MFLYSTNSIEGSRIKIPIFSALTLIGTALLKSQSNTWYKILIHLPSH